LKLKDEHQMGGINGIYLLTGTMKDKDGKKVFLQTEEKSTIVSHSCEVFTIVK